MNARGSRTRAVVLCAAVLGLFSAPETRASAPDSLMLQVPQDVTARSVYNPVERRFVVWLTWRESPDSCAAFINPPDTTGWRVASPLDSLSVPASRGSYSGNIDRTISFRAVRGGVVGQDSIRVTYEVRREEYISGSFYILPGYSPGTPNSWIPVTFRNQNTGALVDYGLELRFSSGVVDAQGLFSVGLEDFEGFHIWRGIEPDGSDLTVIGEISKEEAFKGSANGGSVADSLYFYDLLPTLRQSQTWFSPVGGVECLGSRIDLPLESDQLMWFDCNAANGFTYYYGVTAFDRGYTPSSGSQGLVKTDNCEVAEGIPYECRDQLVQLKMEVDPQNDLYNVFAVPNPYRSGSSRLTSENYHNFPDRLIRFVNVPANCTVRVYTVAGDLVWETSHNGSKGNIEWDVTNRDSQPVTSGVYIYRVETPGGDSVYGRIAVIR